MKDYTVVELAIRRAAENQGPEIKRALRDVAFEIQRVRGISDGQASQELEKLRARIYEPES